VRRENFDGDGTERRNATMTAPLPEASMEATKTPVDNKMTPDENEMLCASSGSHLVNVRLGHVERAILLGINGQAWTSLTEWTERKKRPSLSRAINWLVRLGLIESAYDRVPSKRSSTRRDQNGVEQEYRIYYDRTRKLRLTRLGAQVVEHYREALTHGHRIRWSRFDPDQATIWLTRKAGERRFEIVLPAAMDPNDIPALLAYVRAALNDIELYEKDRNGAFWGEPKAK
jgi:hypothetical protein